MNLDKLNNWNTDDHQHNVNEQSIAISHYTRDQITMKVDTQEVYKSRMYISRAPIQSDKSILKLILKDENADEFVRNINMRLIEDAFTKTLYYKNKMLTGINELMNKPIMDKKEGKVKFSEIKNDKDKIQLHDNVANQFKDDYKFKNKDIQNKYKEDKVKMKFVNKEIKMKNNIHYFNEMK